MQSFNIKEDMLRLQTIVWNYFIARKNRKKKSMTQILTFLNKIKHSKKFKLVLIYIT